MTVRTADHAFLYLSPDGRCSAAGEHRTDRRALRLWIDVVEVEHHRIRFSTVHARVQRQERVDEFAIPDPALWSGAVIPGHVIGLVARVMLFPVLGTARPAVRPER